MNNNNDYKIFLSTVLFIILFYYLNSSTFNNIPICDDKIYYFFSLLAQVVVTIYSGSIAFLIFAISSAESINKKIMSEILIRNRSQILFTLFSISLSLICLLCVINTKIVNITFFKIIIILFFFWALSFMYYLKEAFLFGDHYYQATKLLRYADKNYWKMLHKKWVEEYNSTDKDVKRYLTGVSFVFLDGFDPFRNIYDVESYLLNNDRVEDAFKYNKAFIDYFVNLKEIENFQEIIMQPIFEHIPSKFLVSVTVNKNIFYIQETLDSLVVFYNWAANVKTKQNSNPLFYANFANVLLSNIQILPDIKDKNRIIELYMDFFKKIFEIQYSIEKRIDTTMNAYLLESLRIGIIKKNYILSESLFEYFISVVSRYITKENQIQCKEFLNKYFEYTEKLIAEAQINNAMKFYNKRLWIWILQRLRGSFELFDNHFKNRIKIIFITVLNNDRLTIFDMKDDEIIDLKKFVNLL